MGLVAHREFTSGAELLASYAALRRKIYAVPVKPIHKAVGKQEGPMLIDPRNRGKRPLWCLQDIRFDDHIRRYYGIAKTREKGAKPKVTIANGPKPLWSTGLISFNDHVICYRRHLLLAEQGIQAQDRTNKSKEEIAAEVISRFDNVSLAMLQSPSRTRPLILPRHLVIYMLKETRPELSWGKIGEFMGGRDHTSAYHAHAKIEEMRSQGKLNWFFNARDTE